MLQQLKKLIEERPEAVLYACEELLKVEKDKVVRTVLEYLKTLAKMRVLSRRLQA